jgi:alkylhydroperoxidase family enzyme
MSALLLPLALTAAPLSGEPTTTANSEQVRAREEQILGHPPRVAPIETITDELRELTLPPPGYGTPGEMTMVYRIMLNNPEMVRSSKPIGNFFIVQGSLPARDRELMILRVSWLAKSPYEWGEHVKIAKAAGVANQEVEQIVQGSVAAAWSEHDRALLRAVEELHADAMISDANWDILKKAYDRRQLVEVPMLIGQYFATAYWLNAMRIPLRDGNAGLAAR